MKETILVTGASGTLGAEVCRQILLEGHQGPEVVAFARDRGALLEKCPGLVQYAVGDVRDVFRLIEVCRYHQVTAVVHCAAIKHVGVCEDQPADAIETNIDGVENVLLACEECDIKRAVFVSSDKATDSTVYGMTKLLGERLVAQAARETGNAYNCVRPGNILGSSGSVLAIWKREIAEGKSLTVHVQDGKTAKRFVMSAYQAARFALVGLTCPMSGVVLASSMPVVSMMRLAAAAFPGAAIREEELPGDWLDQTLVSAEETAYMADWNGYYIIDRSLRPAKRIEEISTRRHHPATLERTGQLLADSNILPADVDRRICS